MYGTQPNLRSTLHACMTMGKVSHDDKMRIQTLCEQGKGYKAILSSYPEKGWKLCTVKAICQRFHNTGSAVIRKSGSGRPKTARTQENIAAVHDMICSQDDKPGTSRSSRDIAKELNIDARSVRTIAKKDLHLSAFKRVPVQVISNDTRLKRLSRSKRLLRRLTEARSKQTFFTDEKVFYIHPPVNTQNDRVWAEGKKREVNCSRLLVQRAKFSARIMVSAGVCHGGKGQLHFVHEKAKINSEYYINDMLPKLKEDCVNLLGNNYVFQQDGAPAHTSGVTQKWIKENFPDFIAKDQWPPNSPDLNPLDYHVWGAMLERYQAVSPKPKNKQELCTVIQDIWESLPQEAIDKAVLQFRKRLRACIKADGRHFEHLL